MTSSPCPSRSCENASKKSHGLLREIDNELPGLIGLTPAARTHTIKYRSGEAQALLSVLDVAEAKPALFESLAPLDDGYDPKKFETKVLRDRVERAAILDEFSTDLDDTQAHVSDTMLYLGTHSKPVMLTAYGIAKTVAASDGTVAKLASAAIEFFARIGRASAATKREKKKNKP